MRSKPQILTPQIDSIAEPLAMKTDGFFGDRKGLEKAWEENPKGPKGIERLFDRG